MKLISHAQAPVGAFIHEYRDVSWRGLLYAGLGFGSAAGFILIPRSGGIFWQGAVIPAALALLCFYWSLRRRMNRTRAWFMKSAQEGLYLNTDYSDGYPVPGAPGGVLFIPADWVSQVVPMREVLRLPHRFGLTRHHFSCLDIVCGRDLPEELLRHVEARQSCFAKAGKSGPYPIRIVAPGRIRLNWGWVQPDAVEAVRQLSVNYADDTTRSIVFPDWHRLDKTQKELYLDELWRMGLLSECLFLGREHYRRASAEVRRILEDRNHSGGQRIG